MRNHLLIIFGGILWITFAVYSSASQSDGFPGNNYISDSGDAQVDLDAYLDNFARELSDNHQSELSREMFDYLALYIEENDDIKADIFAKINRLLGAYCFYNAIYERAEGYYFQSIEAYYRSENPDTSGLCTSLSQIGLTFLNLSRHNESVEYLRKSIDLRELYFKEQSSRMVGPLTNLSAVYIDMGEYEMARESALRGIEIAENSGQGNSSLGILYYNLGVYYSKRGDFNNARSLYQLAETKQLEFNSENISQILYIYNGLGVVNNIMGDTLSAINYYEKVIGVLEISEVLVPDGPVYYSNYGIFLANIENYSQALTIFNKAIDYCAENYGGESDKCISAKEDLAYYYNNYLNDYDYSYNIYRELLDKVGDGDYRISLVNSIKRGMAQVQVERGEIDIALDLYNDVLASDEYFDSMDLLYTYSRRSTIYRKKYLVSKKLEDIDSALRDIEYAIHILDSVKMNFSGEDSRLLITGRFDYLWDNSIWLASEKYKIDNKKAYLDLAFRFSEKSKASTLLSSTREVQAMEFHIPEDLVFMERELEQIIQELADKIYVETNSENTDLSLINIYKQRKTDALLDRDSLILVFESEYPRYYNLKHEDKVAQCREVRKFTGKRTDFIEYFLSDTVLYTFILNRKGCQLLSVPIDSLTYEIIREFRSDIINPSIENGARSQFDRIVKNGFELNNLLIEPLKPYLVSKNLVIAADGLLSYIPFEALISDTIGIKPINYRDINFLFKEFRILYTYSASLLIESKGKGKSLVNNALVFAPSYTGLYDSDSILLSRQMERGPLNNIPGAKEEAIYISNLLGGQLFIENEASEHKFVQESSNEKIIHLAMHTLLNDKEPMLSKMIFTLSNNDLENGLLNTYEIYDLDLNAKMVVLSSCNTGSGYLQSGEGVISLARGFMFAGSPSVVMSLWEVDDYSASEIIKSFYLNLKHGYSKSESLKKARKKYLKSSDQLRSHPYFWCSLVIMGDDEPIYYNRITILLIALLILSLIYVVRKYYRPKSS